jgi:uncharacterized membrane protein
MSTERTAEQLASLKQITMVVYILQALSVFVGITAIVGVIINYVKKEDAAGTVFESHFDWQIRTFWWMVAWSVLGFILLIALGLGLLIWFVAGIWAIYRIVKGWLKLNDNQPVVSA